MKRRLLPAWSSIVHHASNLGLVGVLLASSALCHCSSASDGPGGGNDDGANLGDGGASSSSGDEPSVADTPGGDAGANDASRDGQGTVYDECATGNCPNQVRGTNLELWLRGDQGLECKDGRVSIWKDQSGKGRNAQREQQTWALAPKCGIENLNGRAVPTFSGASKEGQETLETDGKFLANSAYTIFMLVRRKNVETDYRMGLLSFQKGDGIYTDTLARTPCTFDVAYQHLSSSGQKHTNNFWHANCGGGTKTIPIAELDPLKSLDLIALRFDPTEGTSAFIDGKKVDEEASSKKPMPSNITSKPLKIGREWYYGYWPSAFEGNIAEIIAYSAALSEGERQKIESYLRVHWDVTL